jgi:hypothetical protein
MIDVPAVAYPPASKKLSIVYVLGLLKILDINLLNSLHSLTKIFGLFIGIKLLSSLSTTSGLGDVITGILP